MLSDCDGFTKAVKAGVIPKNWKDLVEQSEELNDDENTELARLWANIEFDLNNTRMTKKTFLKKIQQFSLPTNLVKLLKTPY